MIIFFLSAQFRLHQIFRSKVTRAMSIAAWADFIILLLDLVEGIIATIHFDESKHEIVYLALYWTLSNLVDANVQDMTERNQCRCRWGECIYKCLAVGGQCALYIHFCEKDARVDSSLITLMVIQIVLKILGTLRWHCGARYSKEDLLVHPTFQNSTSAWQTGGIFENKLLRVLPHAGGGFDSVVGDSHVRQEVVVSKAQKDHCCPCVPYCMDTLYIVMFCCLPLGFQPNSPHRQKWNEVILCVVLWWFSFRLHVLRMRDETDQVRLCAIIRLFDVSYHVYLTVLAYVWGFSGAVVESFDRGYTIYLMVLHFCFFCSCSYGYASRPK